MTKKTTVKKKGTKGKKSAVIQPPSRFQPSNDPKQDKFLAKVNDLLYETGSVHRVIPSNRVLVEVERLERKMAEHQAQYEKIGIVLGTVKGTKLYARLAKEAEEKGTK